MPVGPLLSVQKDPGGRMPQRARRKAYVFRRNPPHGGLTERASPSKYNDSPCSPYGFSGRKPEAADL